MKKTYAAPAISTNGKAAHETLMGSTAASESINVLVFRNSPAAGVGFYL